MEKEATGLRFRRRAFASAFTREEQNCRGAINNEERRRRKKRCLSEIEILVPRRLKQQLKARYSRPSINYSRNWPGVSRESGKSAPNVKLDVDEAASVEMAAKSLISS